MPFGAKASLKSVSSKDEARLHQFGKKMLPRIFMGYVLRVEKGWSGDLLTADCQDLEILSASEIHVKRCRTIESVFMCGHLTVAKGCQEKL